jgi:hypothetical protein
MAALAEQVPATEAESQSSLLRKANLSNGRNSDDRYL